MRGLRRRRPALLAVLVALGAAAVGLLAAGAVWGTGTAGPNASEAGAERATPSPGNRAAGSPEPGQRDDRADQDPGRAGPAAGERPERKPIEWRRSKAIGTHSAGSLRRGVMLPARGRSWVSWDPILKRTPNRQWRRWGTDRMVRSTLGVLREFGRDHPRAPKVPVGDLSRPQGGDFGPQFGSIGHASHQNGLDIDVYYPRRDRKVKPPTSPGQVDLRLAQDLVDRFVAAGAEKVFVGPNLPLTGPPEVVVPLVHHDNHLHARLPLG
jgi:hypothetical protein